MSHSEHKRRKYLVDPEFQYWLISRIAILAFLILAVSLFFLAVVYHLYGDVTVDLIQPDPFGSSGGIKTVASGYPLFSLLWPVLTICLLGTLIVTFIFGIFISHRMAGPVSHMRRTLIQLAEGDLSGELRLRKKDAFKPMADTLNDLRERWKSSIQEMQSLCRALEPYAFDSRYEQHVKRLCEIIETFKTK